jgi:hypothetical protein
VAKKAKSKGCFVDIISKSRLNYLKDDKKDNMLQNEYLNDVSRYLCITYRSNSKNKALKIPDVL